MDHYAIRYPTNGKLSLWCLDMCHGTLTNRTLILLYLVTDIARVIKDLSCKWYTCCYATVYCDNSNLILKYVLVCS